VGEEVRYESLVEGLAAVDDESPPDAPFELSDDFVLSLPLAGASLLVVLAARLEPA
jgi:hypothetical protein